MLLPTAVVVYIAVIVIMRNCAKKKRERERE